MTVLDIQVRYPKLDNFFLHILTYLIYVEDEIKEKDGQTISILIVNLKFTNFDSLPISSLCFGGPYLNGFQTFERNLVIFICTFIQNAV